MLAVKEHGRRVRYFDWPHWKRERLLALAQNKKVDWEPCPTCWGQRRIFIQAPNGEGLIPQNCWSCLGIGERQST